MKFTTSATTVLAISALTGCSTVSFSPPSVNIANQMQVRGSNSSWAKRCMPTEVKKAAAAGTAKTAQPAPKPASVPIEETAEGAIDLTNNFIYYYRCASHSAGNGKQAFEVPSFVSLVGTATAAALGAGPTVAIAGGAANAVFDGGKDYYAPLGKAAIYGHALDAFLCIKATASGVKPFVINAQPAAASVAKNPGAGYFSPERRYYELVSASLFTVERIAAERIRNTGRFDPAGVVAQIEKLTEEVEDAESPQNINENNTNAAEIQKKNGSELKLLGAQAPTTQSIATALNGLDKLHPQLELCALRAKL